MGLKAGDKVVVLRDIYRHDGPETLVSPHPWVTRKYPEVILYAAKDTEGSVLETFRAGDGGWHVKILVGERCLTLRTTSVRRVEEDSEHKAPPQEHRPKPGMRKPRLP